MPRGTALFQHNGATLARIIAEVERGHGPAIELLHQEILRTERRRPGSWWADPASPEDCSEDTLDVRPPLNAVHRTIRSGTRREKHRGVLCEVRHEAGSVAAAECGEKTHHCLARIRFRTLREARHRHSKEQNGRTGQPLHANKVYLVNPCAPRRG